jgi:hypothetical protein
VSRGCGETSSVSIAKDTRKRLGRNFVNNLEEQVRDLDNLIAKVKPDLGKSKPLDRPNESKKGTVTMTAAPSAPPATAAP